MKKHKDLLAVLRSNEMRITPARKLMLQYVLDNSTKQISLKEIHVFMEKHMPGVDRSSIYRNLEAFKRLDLIQELNLPSVGKRFQYIFDRRVHDYFICKSCGKLNRGNKALFEKIDAALKDIHGFSKANLSIIFYGHCSSCAKKSRAS